MKYEENVWYGWNGGECPVHPESVGDMTYFDGVVYKDSKLGQFTWEVPLLFRVTKEHREPREFWVSNNDGFAHESLESVLNDPLTEKHGYIHVREVLE